MAAADAGKSTTKGQAWFCTTGLPSDIVIEVEDMTFHLHKFPLMSKSLWLHDTIKEFEKNPTEKRGERGGNSDSGGEIEEEEDEDEDGYTCHITLPDFPGGSEAFEAAAKFCYGVKIELTPSNVAPLRCAAHVLHMTEEYSEDNLIARTEKYITQNVPRNIKHSIQTLHSCENLAPLAEDLGIVDRCISAVASKASENPAPFGWPVSDRRKSAAAAGADAWLDELTLLSLELFKRLIAGMKEKEVGGEVIENCLMYYSKKRIPGISRANRKSTSSAASTSSSSIPSESEQRELLETVVASLPAERSSTSSAITRFLFGLLRTANILICSEESRAALEKKIGSQLEQATLDDLLIPSYSYLNETLYDVDCVERILAHFLRGLDERSSGGGEEDENGTSMRSAALMLVGKLIDGYLSEIASDGNLKPERFYQFALSLPDQARLFDDGLYRAVDVYLKSHPWISESEREKVCGVLDCQKLTLEACTHAAQNERLPLRAVVQVLFFEQLQLRHAIAGTLLAAEFPPALEEAGGEDEATAMGMMTRVEGNGSTWRSTVRENQVLRLDMDSMRNRVHELERECSTMKKAIEKIDKAPEAPRRVKEGGGGRGGGGNNGWRNKFGCKFKTQVCDSQSSATVVEARKGRSNRSAPQ